MLKVRGWSECPDCKNRTAITLYIQKRVNGTRRFIKFGKYCGNCAEGLKLGSEVKRIVTEVIMKNKYRLAPKIKTEGAPI